MGIICLTWRNKSRETTSVSVIHGLRDFIHLKKSGEMKLNERVKQQLKWQNPWQWVENVTKLYADLTAAGQTQITLDSSELSAKGF